MYSNIYNTMVYIILWYIILYTIVYCVYINYVIYTHIYLFIIRYWLMWLQRLKSHDSRPASWRGRKRWWYSSKA